MGIRKKLVYIRISILKQRGFHGMSEVFLWLAWVTWAKKTQQPLIAAGTPWKKCF